MELTAKDRVRDLKDRQKAPLLTPTDLATEAIHEITAAMNGLLADSFVPYLKTKNFHSERRTWFLFEAVRPADTSGH